MSTIIEVNSLYKKFKNSIVLNGVTISFEENKIHGIIGRNGSGKTMLFKCMIGLIPFSDGEIRIRSKRIGKDIDTPDDIGVIIEGPGFLPNYSAYRNLLFLSLIRNVISKNQIKRAVEMVGLDPNNRKWVGKFSMGMRQRLCIAQAIMENPSLLILDEPMNGLDNRGVEDIRNLLLDLKNHGKTILLASHNHDDIFQLCDTICEMDNGSLIQIK